MNKPEREAAIEKYFCWAVSSIGGKTYKFKSISQRGVADRVACLPNGETWFVELKRPKGGVLAPMQELFAESMVALKQRYALLNTVESINEWSAKIKL